MPEPAELTGPGEPPQVAEQPELAGTSQAAEMLEASDQPEPAELTGPGQPPEADDQPEPAEAPAMTEAAAKAALEAILMVVDQPASATDLSIAVGWPVQDTEQLLISLASEYRGEGGGPVRGFVLRQLAGGWRFFSNPDHAAAVERFIKEGATAKLSQAALETLAVVAYKGPLSRGQMSQVRGVAVDSVVRTLVSRGLVEEVGTDQSSGAVLFATTQFFLQTMGLASLDQLEPLAPYLPAGEELIQIQEQIEP